MGYALLVGWLALAAFETGFFAGDRGEEWQIWAIGALLVAVHYAVARIVMDLLARCRAAQRVPADTDVELEEWGDHLLVRCDGRDKVIAFETIAATALTATHIIISAPPETLIVPRSAFGDLAESVALQARIDDAGHDT